MAIRFGLCRGFDKIEFAAKAGFDYLEPAFRSLVELSEEDFEKVKARCVEQNLFCETFNLFAPPGNFASLRAEDMDFDALKEFTEKGMKRAQELGGKVVVIGCGWLRGVPEGMDFGHATEEMAKTFRFCADIAAKYGIKIVAEPLNRGETNFINTIKDGEAFVNYCKHPAIGGLIDFFHTFKNEEDLDEIKSCMPCIIHTHLARPNHDRGRPEEEDIPMMEKWADILKGAGYEGRLSLECGTKQDYDEEDELAKGLVILRRVFG